MRPKVPELGAELHRRVTPIDWEMAAGRRKLWPILLTPATCAVSGAIVYCVCSSSTRDVGLVAFGVGLYVFLRSYVERLARW